MFCQTKWAHLKRAFLDVIQKSPEQLSVVYLKCIRFRFYIERQQFVKGLENEQFDDTFRNRKRLQSS